MALSFLMAVVEVLQERGPLEVFSLAAAAGMQTPKKGRPLVLTDGSKLKSMQEDILPLVREILESVKRGGHRLRIIEYPAYQLKRSIPKTPLRGRYLRCALESLAESSRPLSLDKLAVHYSQRFGHNAVAPEFWMFATLQGNGKRFVTQAGALRVGLQPDAMPVGTTRDRRKASPTELTSIEPVHARIYEENLESLILERLGEIEPGLTLVQRQYVTPVGRIDVLCRDRKRNFVVIELKRFRASTESIIDQITRYIGWVEQHLV